MESFEYFAKDLEGVKVDSGNNNNEFDDDEVDGKVEGRKEGVFGAVVVEGLEEVRNKEVPFEPFDFDFDLEDAKVDSGNNNNKAVDGKVEGREGDGGFGVVEVVVEKLE